MQAQTIARPYAKAVFGRAADKKQQQQWQQFLTLSAALVADVDIKKRLGLPNFMVDLVQWLDQWLQEQRQQTLTQEEKNFLQVLQDQDRLMILPEIAQIFAELVHEQDQVCAVYVQTAHELDEESEKLLKATMVRKIGRDVEMTVSVNPELMAGVLIEYNGQVIDQTLKGRLSDFAQLLN